MPHIVVEYSDNVASGFKPQALLAKLSQTMLDSGQFQRDDIKARAIKHDTYLVGLSPDKGFIHVRISLMSGRAEAIRTHLAESLMAALRQEVKPAAALSLTVEISEMDHAAYLKETLIPEKELL